MGERGKGQRELKKTTHTHTHTQSDSAVFIFLLPPREIPLVLWKRRHPRMFDQLGCIKVRIDFAIIGNQSEMDFFSCTSLREQTYYLTTAFSIFAHIAWIFCHCAIAIVHLLIFTAVLILFILKAYRNGHSTAFVLVTCLLFSDEYSKMSYFWHFLLVYNFHEPLN